MAQPRKARGRGCLGLMVITMDIDEIEEYLVNQAKWAGFLVSPDWIRERFAELRAREQARRERKVFYNKEEVLEYLKNEAKKGEEIMFIDKRGRV